LNQVADSCSGITAVALVCIYIKGIAKCFDWYT